MFFSQVRKKFYKIKEKRSMELEMNKHGKVSSKAHKGLTLKLIKEKHKATKIYIKGLKP